MSDELIVNVDDILIILTNILRDEKANTIDRIKAAELLGKYYKL